MSNARVRHRRRWRNRRAARNQQVSDERIQSTLFSKILSAEIMKRVFDDDYAMANRFSPFGPETDKVIEREIKIRLPVDLSHVKCELKVSL